jgi:hypothetical protein
MSFCVLWAFPEHVGAIFIEDPFVNPTLSTLIFCDRLFSKMKEEEMREFSTEMHGERLR